MTKIVAVDTNVLLDYRLKRQPGFKQAAELIADCLSNKLQIFIPQIVFAEAEWVLRSYYKQPKEEIVEFLEEILALDGVIVSDKVDLQQTLAMFKQANIKFSDCMILIQVQNFGPDEFLTFDEDLKKLYSANFRH